MYFFNKILTLLQRKEHISFLISVMFILHVSDTYQSSLIEKHVIKVLRAVKFLIKSCCCLQ